MAKDDNTPDPKADERVSALAADAAAAQADATATPADNPQPSQAKEETRGTDVAGGDQGPTGRPTGVRSTTLDGADAPGSGNGVADEQVAPKFYRCREFAGLSITVDARDVRDPNQLVEVRFVPYAEKWQGETVKVGYLETTSSRAQQILAADGFVEEIDKAEFEKSTDPEKSERVAY